MHLQWPANISSRVLSSINKYAVSYYYTFTVGFHLHTVTRNPNFISFFQLLLLGYKGSQISNKDSSSIYRIGGRAISCQTTTHLPSTECRAMSSLSAYKRWCCIYGKVKRDQFCTWTSKPCHEMRWDGPRYVKRLICTLKGYRIWCSVAKCY